MGDQVCHADPAAIVISGHRITFGSRRGFPEERITCCLVISWTAAPVTRDMFSVGDADAPRDVLDFLSDLSLSVVRVHDEDALLTLCLRSRPRLVVLDARAYRADAERACRRLKADSYTAVIPAVILLAEIGEAWQNASVNADEVLHAGMSRDETCYRLTAAMRRSDRDVSVHPSTRLPGAVGIEAELARGIEAGETFAVCYADLDHFKEYNDRYSYFEGDRVIRMLAKLLHDIVKGVCGERGFVGHIGGDDFIFIVPPSRIDDDVRPNHRDL